MTMTDHQYPRADLHIHSVHSDGTYSVEKIVERAREENLQAISITDHDSVQGIDQAFSLTSDTDIRVITGIEFSSTHNEFNMHLLGYFIDHQNQDLLDYLDLCRQRRLTRTEIMVDKLQQSGISVTVDQVMDIAQGGILGRPHVAAAVMEVSSYTEMHAVFKDLLVKGKPAYVPKPTFDAGQIIDLIHSCGGVCSLAHPRTVGDDTIIPRLSNLGLDAIEVVHSSHSLHQMEKYSAYADQYNLVISGGSDCHGERLGREIIGKYTISIEQVERLESRAEKKRQSKTY